MTASLLASLKTLQEAGPRIVYSGICGYTMANECSYSTSAAMERLFRAWPEFSGDKDFPVPYEGLTPMEAYLTIANKWEGPYGDARKRLLAFMIDELEKDSE